MANQPRFIPPGTLAFMTMTTNADRFHFRPSAALNAAILGIIGRALAMYPVALHAMVWMSNHWHALLTPCDGQAMTAFLRYVHSETAKAAKRINGVKGKVWRTHRPSIIPVLDDDAQLERLKYILSHGTKERLVASPLEWPGVHCAEALSTDSTMIGDWEDGVLKNRLTRRREPHPCEYTIRYPIHFAPLPALANLSSEQRAELVQNMLADILVETPGPFLGAEAVVAANPDDEPQKPKKSKRAPAVFTTSDTLRQGYLALRANFRKAYREAAKTHRAVPTAVSWPEGNFLPACQFVPQYASEGIANQRRLVDPGPSLLAMVYDETRAPPCTAPL